MHRHPAAGPTSNSATSDRSTNRPRTGTAAPSSSSSGAKCTNSRLKQAGGVRSSPAAEDGRPPSKSNDFSLQALSAESARNRYKRRLSTRTTCRTLARSRWSIEPP